MYGLDLNFKCFGQLWKVRCAGGRCLDGQVAKHVATAGVVVVMVGTRLMDIMGIS